MTLVKLMLFAHVSFGVLYGVAFLVGLILLISKGRYIKHVACLGVTGFVSGLISLVTGGYYYVVNYGSNVKPAIKKGLDVVVDASGEATQSVSGAKWIHSVIMETKEHEYLLLLAFTFVAVMFVWYFRNNLMENDSVRKLAIWLYATAFVGFGTIYVQGIMITATVRFINDGVRSILPLIQ